MDSLTLNQSLEMYGQAPVATCQLSAPTDEAIALLKKGWSHVVVLDQNDQPQGLFNAQCLLNWQSEVDSCTFVAPSSALKDIDLEPLPAIAISTTIADFLQRISQYQHSAENWALVNESGKFMALMEVSGLLRSLIQTEQNQQPSIISVLSPLIYQLPLPIMISDRQGGIVAMNSAWSSSIDGSLPPKAGNHNETHQFCTTDGASFTWQVISVALQGALDGLELAIAYDITAQKNLAQDLSGLSRIKDEFLTCVNHELKTPLTSIIGIASLLGNNSLGALNERQSRYVKMIHQSGRQLVSVIDNIFDLAKAESGQLELYAEIVSIKDVCQKSIQQVRKLIQQDSTVSRNHNFEEGWELDVDLDIDQTVQKTIFVDEARLEQMLVSLLSNAFKFSLFPSELVDDLPTVIPKIGIKVRLWEDWLALTVWDQGIGIPEDKQFLVFKKFQQVENVLTRRFEGTGSSLLLARHLARLHGGDITFVSQVDVGSQFTILLPPEPNNANPHIEQIDRRKDTGHSRLVLIVETSTEVLDWLIKTLSDLEYQVVVARLGTEALEKARRLQPCLILLSPDVPMLSGWDVLALLKGDILTQHIRVVMMKRSNEPQIFSHQADGILIKPIKTVELKFFLPNDVAIPKSLKFLYLNHNLEDAVINLFQDLGHCLLEANDFKQCEVLSKIWQPDLFLLDGDNKFLLQHLEDISRLNILSDVTILIITHSAIAEIDWLQNRFANLSLHDCVGIDLKHLDTNHAEVLRDLHQSITNAICYPTPRAQPSISVGSIKHDEPRE